MTAAPLRTPDDRYLVVKGRLWRASDPGLSAGERQRLVHALMAARRAVGIALRTQDDAAERVARTDVDRIKHALGERGAVWWDDGAPDLTRTLARNSPYAGWFADATADT